MKKFSLVILTIVFVLFASEIFVRVFYPPSVDLFAHNPVLQKQASGTEIFELNGVLGHRLKNGCFIDCYGIGFSCISDVQEDLKENDKLVVLNIGDSSTSGWDSCVVLENAVRKKNGQSLLSPFYNYKTYSDFLAEDERLYVINAGVPGYSSFQGAIYLKQLLNDFKKAEINIDVVTIYFGNNDCTWNNNETDEYLLSRSLFKIHLKKFTNSVSNLFKVAERVSLPDFRNNLNGMIKTCKQNEVEIILIEPVIPKMWPPGLRAEGLKDEVDNFATLSKKIQVGKKFLKARENYKKGMAKLLKQNHTVATEHFIMAQQFDYVVPRIKKSYLQAIQNVSQANDVRLISVASKIPINDRGYFVDYCHPDESANTLIAKELIAGLIELGIVFK